jgi:hypothetical protein
VTGDDLVNYLILRAKQAAQTAEMIARMEDDHRDHEDEREEA